MPSQSNIPNSRGARDNNAAAVDDVIKDEVDVDDGPIPFFADGGGGAPDVGGDCGRTVHSVSPTNATPCKREEDDLTTVNSEKGATLRQPDLMRSNSNDNYEKEKDILLKDEKYKKIYSQYCEKLWGGKRDESLTTGDVGKRMLNKFHLYRGSKGGNTASPASDKVALESKCICITICISSTTSKFTYLPPFYSVH